MTHIDLFSGIGGFAYAAKQVWPDYHNLFFCDNNKFCQAVLRKNFGQDSLIYGDIREVTVERVIADTEPTRLEGYEEKQRNGGSRKRNTMGQGLRATDTIPVDLLTGGFPCQPFSVAGKRAGRDDDRHLWPEMFRVIKEFRPRWVIGENVRGLINIENGMALEQVFLDLEGIGYAVQAFVIPACAVNAPHRRDRIWIVAHADNGREGRAVRETLSGRQGQAVTNSELGGRDSGGNCLHRQGAADRHAADADGERLQNSRKRSDTSRLIRGRDKQDQGNGWQQPWLEVATRLCRVDDGLPAGVDGNAKGITGGYKVKPGGEWGEYLISKSKHREERLKALGNAIVPQVAVEIMKAILMKP